MPGAADNQLRRRQPWSLQLGFMGWWSLVVLMAFASYALDFWEGDALVGTARWLQHVGFFGASLVGWGRYLSLSRKQPMEGLIEAIKGVDRSALEVEDKALSRRGSGLLYHGSLIIGLAGLVSCALSLEKRLIILPLVDGLWLMAALIWLVMSHRRRIGAAKEHLKEVLDDLRSKRRPKNALVMKVRGRVQPLALGVTLLGLTLVGWASVWRILSSDKALYMAELRVCMKVVLQEVEQNGDLRNILPRECNEKIRTRFKIIGSGVGETRLISARELEGIDALGDGIKGNQRLGLRSDGLFIHTR